MTDFERCVRCDEETQAGTRRFIGRQRLGDDRFLCSECTTGGDGELERPDVPITMPNTNFPNTH